MPPLGHHDQHIEIGRSTPCSSSPHTRWSPFSLRRQDHTTRSLAMSCFSSVT